MSSNSFATDRQRFQNLPAVGAVYELWHKTGTGLSVSCGFVDRGDGDGMIIKARRKMRDSHPADAPVTFHLVEAGSYAGWPAPDLGPKNRIEPDPTQSVPGTA